MKRMLSYCLLACVLGLCYSCNQPVPIDWVPYVQKVVVEGEIENGQFASVLLSTTASFTGKIDTVSLLNHAIKNARIAVSDGSDSDVLVLQTNDNKIPPYEYRGTKLRGVPGKTYTLRIEYADSVISASTYIPEPVPLDSIHFVSHPPSDTTANLYIQFHNTSTEYYQVSTQVDSVEHLFTPCLYGNIDSREYSPDEKVSIPISKGPILYPTPSIVTYFKNPSRVFVKFKTQSYSGYRFWTSYQNQIINGQNPFFPSNESMYTNIKGGIGIWCGYGSNTYLVNIVGI